MIRRLFAPDGNPQGDPTPEPVAAPDASVTATPEPAAEPTPQPEPEPDSAAGLKAAASAERKKRQEAQTQLAAAREEAAYLRGQMAVAKPVEPVAPVAPAGPPEAPRSEDFDDWDQFQAADRQHIIETARYEARREVLTLQQQQVQQRTQQEVEGNWQRQRSTAQTKYPDFNEVVTNPMFQQSETVATLIKQSEQGADVAYFLGTNLGECNRINALPPLMAAMALGQIADRLASRPAAVAPRVVSMAPEPVSTVTGNVSLNGAFDPETATMEEYRAHRQAELRGQRH